MYAQRVQTAAITAVEFGGAGQKEELLFRRKSGTLLDIGKRAKGSRRVPPAPYIEKAAAPRPGAEAARSC